MAFDPKDMQRRRDLDRLASGPVPLLGMPTKQAPPAETPSDYECPNCGDIPVLAPSPPQPPGTPAALNLVSVEGGEMRQTFQCVGCYVRFLRKYVPALVKRGAGVADPPVADIEEPG